MKIFTLLWILLFTVQIFTQEKHVSLKFDEFSDYPAEKISPLDERTERFGKIMKREPKNKKAIIIYYNQRKGKYPLEGGKKWAKSAAWDLEHNYDFPIDKERIILIEGGYREYPTLEFWIAPPGAEMPAPTPTFTKDEIVYCPDINIAGDGFGNDGTNPLKFSVVLQGAGTDQSFPMEWSVSVGKIIKGQGTNLIETDISQTKVKRVTASLIVKGLPPECQSHQFHTTEVGRFPNKIDEFPHIPYSYLAARIQSSVAVELANDPTATIQITIYGSREGYKKDITIVTRSLARAIDFMKLDRSRIKIVEGGFREEMFVEVYLIPAGVEPPKPTPTLNADFVVPPPKTIKKRKKTK